MVVRARGRDRGEEISRRMMMREGSAIAAGLALCALASVAMTASPVRAADDKYPDWTGAWGRFVVRGLGGQPSFDQTKPWGRGQEAPLTAEYQKVLEDSLADAAAGIRGAAGGDLYPGRGVGPLSPHLHRRPRLAEGDRGKLLRLLDRQMD